VKKWEKAIVYVILTPFVLFAVWWWTLRPLELSGIIISFDGFWINIVAAAAILIAGAVLSWLYDFVMHGRRSWWRGDGE
jgi:hypothetical protein